LKSPLKWIGGKHRHARRYIELFPKHDIFVSLFCGGCHVEIAKLPSRIEIVNDINDRLVNFLLILRDRPDELYRLCEGLPYAESLYNKYKWGKEPEDSLERAVRFFYIVRAGFSGGGHKYRTGFSISSTVDKANTYRSAVELIPKMAERIKQWNILCRDFQNVIKRYDSENTFFFCDPPYVGHEDLYSGGFSRKDHYRLRECLGDIKGKAMVCYYKNPLIEEIYQDWYTEEYIMKSKIQQRNFRESCPARKELILMNYEPCTQISFQEVRDCGRL